MTGAHSFLEIKKEITDVIRNLPRYDIFRLTLWIPLIVMSYLRYFQVKTKYYTITSINC